VDGNLTCAKNDSIAEVHWQGKFRGPEFAPMNFLIKTVTHQHLKDSDGRLIPTVIAEALSDQARDEIAATGKRDGDAILALIEANPAATNSSLATAMGWKLHGGEPNKMKAHRCVGSLKAAKLIKETRADVTSSPRKARKSSQVKKRSNGRSKNQPERPQKTTKNAVTADTPKMSLA
jgi:hypothetical protein